MKPGRGGGGGDPAYLETIPLFFGGIFLVRSLCVFILGHLHENWNLIAS